MHIKNLPQNKKVWHQNFLCAFFKKIYFKRETIYNLCSFLGRWGSREKKTFHFFVQEMNVNGQYWLWHQNRKSVDL